MIDLDYSAGFWKVNWIFSFLRIILINYNIITLFKCLLIYEYLSVNNYNKSRIIRFQFENRLSAIEIQYFFMFCFFNSLVLSLLYLFIFILIYLLLLNPSLMCSDYCVVICHYLHHTMITSLISAGDTNGRSNLFLK